MTALRRAAGRRAHAPAARARENGAPEETLKRKLERLDLLTDATIDGLYDWDLASGELWHSRRVKTLLGYAEAEWADSYDTWCRLLHPDDRELVMEGVARALAAVTDFRAEYRLLGKDGRYRWFRDTGRAIAGPGGKAARMVGSLHDVTADREAEAALAEANRRLEESEAKIRSIVANVPGAIYRCAPEPGWPMEYISKAIEDITGYPASDFTGSRKLSFASLVKPEDRADWDEAILERLKSGQPLSSEYCVRHADGSLRWVHERSRGVFDESGRLVAVDGSIFDITGRKLVEEEAARTALLVQELIDHAPLQINVKDPEGRYRLVNRVLAEDMGRPRNEIIGRTVYDFYAEEVGDVTTLNHKRVLAERKAVQHEQHVARGGRTQHLIATRFPIFDEAGEILAVGYIGADVTERKEAELMLRERETQFSSMAMNIPGAIYRGRYDEDWTLTYVSEAIEELTGYPATDFVDNRMRSFGSLIVPEDRPRVHATVRSCLEGRRPYAVEYRIRRADGELRWVVEKGRGIFDEAGATKWLDGAIFDITERKNTEQALERSNKELEQFAYVASHDLQEPLRMVGSYCQLLQRRYADRLDDDAREFIEYAVDGAQRMQALINDLLSYSRVGTRGKPFAPTDCEAVFATALENLKAACAERGAVVTHDPLPTVHGDAGQLVQLFQNLVGNGIKFCRGRTPRIRVAAKPQNGHWMFSVSDNGIGIEPEYAERVFGIFQRLQTRDEFHGTGIGLAICKKIVERHGGRIWIESTPGEGTTFHFTLSTLPGGDDGEIEAV